MPDDGGTRTRRERTGWALVGLGAMVGGGAVATAAAIALIAGSVLSLGGALLGGLGEVRIGDPGPGTDSLRLPVAVAPTEGLREGQTVFVTSDAFEAEEVVGVALCLREADEKSRGVEACDLDSGARFAIDAEGRLAAALAVPRVITVAGEAHDCGAEPGRCLVVAADADDFDVSGGEPVSFAADAPAPALVPADPRPRTFLLPGELAPEGPHRVGDEVVVTASGFVPGEPLLVATCTDAFLHAEPWAACEPRDGNEAVMALMTRSTRGVTLRADDAGRVQLSVTVPGGVASYGSEVGASCTRRAGACAVVVAAAADTARSAYLPLTVSP